VALAANGVITATTSTDPSVVLTFSPDVGGGRINWICTHTSAGTVTDRQIPAECRN
jgi:hypothetical protein